ncbi:hypothetical protein COCON_G00016130 [Conger conger]|uniref:KASH domain-containing protein n=1 Tax=Conger conger TaxID=82655 RepID=A0A9Q1E446_CONCO|nr:hypothetical protein COCON_G00016130 [Conger conger]
MEQVKELFADNSDVFQELMAVRRDIAERISECQSSLQAIEAAMSMLSATDNPQLLAQIQELSERLHSEAEQADSLLKEVSLMAGVASPHALRALTAEGARLKESVRHAQELIVQKKEQVERGFLRAIKDDCQAFEEWFQDLQLSVNECFENPEQREDVEASLQRLTQGFLGFKEGERRLARLKERLANAGEELHSDQLDPLSVLLQDQEKELTTFRAHCQDRHNHLEACLGTLNSLREEYSHMDTWLQAREHKLAQGEELNRLQEEVLKERDRIEGLTSLVVAVRGQGLRSDRLVRESDDLLQRYHGLLARLDSQAEAQSTLVRETQAFEAQAESTRAWIGDLQQRVKSLDKGTVGTQAEIEDRMQKVQALLSTRYEGESKLQGLRWGAQRLSQQKDLEKGRRCGVLQTVKDAEEQWRGVMQSAEELLGQAEAQSALVRETQAFEAQAESSRAWIGDLQQRVNSLDKGTVGTQAEIEDTLQKVKALLSVRYEGESKLQDLKQSGQRLSQQKGLEESRRCGVLLSVGDAEEQWRGVMQSAEELLGQAEAQSALVRETQAFEAQAESTRAWIGDLQQRAQSLDKGTVGTQSEIEDRMQKVQALLNTRHEGESKLQDLKQSGQRLSQQKDLDESRRCGVLQTVGDAEEQWRGVMQSAEELLRQAEAQSALVRETQAFEAQAESTRAWIGDLQQRVHSLDKGTVGTQAEIENRMQKVQALLNTRYEGESKLQDLRQSRQSLSQQKGLDESRRLGVLQTVGDAEEQWRGVMQSAEELFQDVGELLRQAEAQSALVRETQAFEAQAESTRAWIGDLQQRVKSLDKGTVGTQAEIEDRLQKVQALVSARSEGECKLQDLKQSGQRLSQQKGLEESRRCGVLLSVKDAEEQCRGVMQSAEELLRMLESLVERLLSGLYQKQQAQDRVEQLQRQTADLPRQFPWPGLGDRRLAVEHVRSLLNRTRALPPALSELQAQGVELFQLTQDPSWIDPSWGALEKRLPPLLKELTDVSGSLEEGIQTERHCAQLVEQHSAALDWLQEQVRGLGPLPHDRAGLQSTINTLKALLQTADREGKEMRELDAVKASLLLLCTPSGQTSLQEEVGRMQEKRARSDTQARDRLRECEARLQDIDRQLNRRAQQLREETSGLQRDLHKLGQSMDCSQMPADVGHLQDQWNTLKHCERPLEQLGVRVQDLQQALASEVTNVALPSDVVSDVAVVAEEQSRLRTRLSESLDSCAQHTMHSLRDSLQALQLWNKSAHTPLSSGSTQNMQAALDEGERLRLALKGVLSHEQFLKDSVGLEQMEKLGRDSSDVLKDSGVHISNLTHTLQKRKQEAVSERPTSVAEQQHVLNLLDTQVQKHTPQVCHKTEEVDSARLKAGVKPHADKEVVLSQQEVSVSSWPADVSGLRTAPHDHKVKTGLQADTLRKRVEQGATEPREIRTTDYLWSPDTEETQRRYLVLDLPELAEVQKVSEKPIKDQGHVDQVEFKSATEKDSAQQQAKVPEAEREHVETPKTVHPGAREYVAQSSNEVMEKDKSMRLPFISMALAEPGLGSSDTAAELSEGKESRDLESIKLPQQEEKSTMKLPAWSEANQKVSEEGASEAGDITRREDLPLELPHRPTMQETFSEIQQLVETGPNNFVIGGKPLWEPLGSLDTSHRDLETRLSHVVFRILNCRNRPAQLNTTAMTQQVEEAEDCRQCAQEQLAAFSRMCESEDRVSDTAQPMEGQWSAALWEASAAVQAKEAQLQLVTQYHKQSLAAKATQEKLAAELEALRAAPVESCSQKAEKLRAVLSDLEQERTVIGELLQTNTQLSPYLGQSDRLVAHTLLEHLQREWRELERDAEKMLYQVSVQIQESGDLLQEAQELQGQLDTLQQSLGPPQPSTDQWDRQRAGQLMVMDSSLTAANQHYLHMQQQTSDTLFQRFQGEKEKRDIEQALHCVKEQVDCLQGQISRQIPSSSNTTLGKIMKVMHEAFTWAKQTESNIEASKKVVLLPEGVHSQIKGLKKLQSEITTKQSQLESFVEEVRELIPELDEKDTPMVHSSLNTLKGLSKSTAEKLARGLQDMEVGLQTREKMSEQIADVDSWVVAHVHKQTVRDTISGGSTAELQRKLRQLQETLKKADKQAAVTEALLMRSRDIAPELTVIENCRLNDKLISLQEDIKGIISCEKKNCRELEALLQAQDSARKKLASVEISLRQMLVDLNRFRFPITRDSLCGVEPIKQMILEQKSQVDQLHPCKEDKRKELLCKIAEMQNKVNVLGQKAEQHERYLYCRQRIEDLKEKVETHLKVKDESISKEEWFKNCQALLIQFPLIQNLCKVAEVELQNISTDLYPSEVNSEHTRLRQAAKSFSTWALTVSNNASILEWELINNLHYPTEYKAMVELLKDANGELEQPTPVASEEQAIDRELLKCATLRRNVESRARVLEALEPRNGFGQKGQEHKTADLADLKKKTLNGCEMRMENLFQAREMLGDYSRSVRGAVRFLQEAETRFLLPLDYAGSCPEELQRIQQALASLDEEFKSYITQIQALVPQHSCLSPYQAEQLHSTVLSQLLVRVSTLQAQARLRMETLQKCSKKEILYRKCHKEICQRLKTVEASLSECISYNAISYKACLDQQEKLKALVLEVDSLTGRLEGLREWCPERGCSRGREEALSTLWKEWARLQRCARYLKARSVQRGAEWRHITKSVERATVILDQLRDELPECSSEKATLEELQEGLVYTEQYQDRLDCEHRALTALELRAARLLGVPAHQEQSPPIPLCQELQIMQGRFKNLKEKSMLGRQAVHSEVQERERVKEEISGVKEWLVAAVSLLSVMEDLPSTQELQEMQGQLCSQKAVLQGIMDGLKMKYSDMYTLVPVDIDGPLQEVNRSLLEVEEKVGEAVEKSGPLCRLGGKVEEIRVGLQVVLASLEKRSVSVAEAERRQKRVWDELDRWHSRVAALEVEVHDIADDHPEAAHVLTDKLMETLQLYQHVAKQAEQRTAFLSKIHTCLEEHGEMINSSNNWLIEAHTWLTAPCTYTTAKCLSSHVDALQMVLDDSEQMRRTLQGFAAVLQEVSSVCNMTTQEELLAQADQRVAIMQESIASQLSQFQHAAAEVEAIESEVEKMEKTLNKFRDILSSQDSTVPPPEDHCKNMQVILNDTESMKRTMAEIQNCKPGLCLPEEAEESLTIFNRAQLLLQQVQSLEQTITEQNPTLKVAVEQSLELGELSTSTSEEIIIPSPTLSVLDEFQEIHIEEGQIQIAHVEEDVLKRSGASLMTVETSPEQEQSLGSERTTQFAEQEAHIIGMSLNLAGVYIPDITKQELWYMPLSEEEEDGGSSDSSSSGTLTFSTPEDPDEVLIEGEPPGTSDASLEQSLGRDEVFEPQPDSSTQDIVGVTLPTEAAEAEAHSKPVATVRTQALPQSMELLGQSGLAWQGAASQPERLKTQSQDTHGTHKPAALTLRDASHTFPLAASTTLEALNSDTLTEEAHHSRTTPSQVAQDTGRAPPAPAEDTGLQETPKKQPPPVGSLSAERQVSDIDSVRSVHALNKRTHTPAKQTMQTLAQSAEGCTPPALSKDTPAPRHAVLTHVKSSDTVHKHTRSQDTLRLLRDDADSLCPAALLASGEPCPAQGVLHACHEQADQLELWLERARQSLGAASGAAAMQDSFEQQLLNCQDMFLEIEQKVASLSELGQQEVASGAHQQVEALSSKLELLKSSLVTFQMLLQERQNVEQEMQQEEHPQERVLKRSTSVHEMLTSTESKLTRQNSLQQQRELEQELSEQRDLTKAIARHSSRSRMNSLSQDNQSQAPAGSLPVPSTAPAEGEEVFTSEEKWAHLHAQLAAKLQALEGNANQGSSEVTGTAVAAGSSVAARDPGTHTVQELQTHTIRLRELGHLAMTSQTQASSDGDCGLTLEEDLYRELCGVDLSLCSVTDLLLAPCGTCLEDHRLHLLLLESLAVELDKLGNELGCQESEVYHALGSVAPLAAPCQDHLLSRLSVIQTHLLSRQAQMHTLLDLTDQCQRDIRGLHESLLGKNLLLNQTINEASGHDHPGKQFQAVQQLQLDVLLQETQVSALKGRVESQSLPTALIEEVHKLEDVLDSAWSSLRERRGELRESLELQQQYEGLLQGLASLAELGRERLGRSLGLVEHSRAELQDHLSRHQSYFQRLGSHLAAVQHFSLRVPDSELRGREGALAQLVQDVSALQRQALEHGTQMRTTLQTWMHFEENCSMLGRLLQEVESRLPSVGLVEETEERLQERLSIYQQMKGVLEESGARQCLVLEQGRGLQAGGRRRDVTAALRELEARWPAVRGRVEQDALRVDRLRRIWSRFRRDSVALSEWLAEARERLQMWRQRSVTVPPQDLEQIRTHLAQFLVFYKEVEARSVLKASVVSTGTQLLLLKDTDTGSLQTQLTQLEQGWAQVLSALPAIQERLHQALMERVPSREAIAELNTWITEREVMLKDGLKWLPSHKGSAASLTQELQLLKEYKLEITCHQLTVDFVNQSVLQISSPDIQTKRYERTQFAEELGSLNERWHHLQGTLSYQTRHMEQLLHICADRENKLQHLRRWLIGQRERMQLAERPASRSSAVKALKECEETEKKLKLKLAELQVLRELCQSLDEGTEQGHDCEFITQTDTVNQACAALHEQMVEVRQRLQQVLERWGLFERRLNEAALSTAKAHYMLEQERSPQLSFSALQSQANQLQLLREELERGEIIWDALTVTFSALRDMVSPAAARLLAEQLEREQTRWRVVIQELTDEQLRVKGLLQRWQGYSHLFAAISRRLKRHEEETKELLSAAPCQDDSVELIQARAEAITGLQKCTDELQNSVEEVLEASRNLIGQMEPGAAVFIQSESRLLARSVLQLAEALAGRKEQLQEELEQLQELSSSLDFLEKHLKDCEGRVTVALDISDGDFAKTDLLALSTLSPDLDVLNELSYRLSLSDPVSRRLQTLNRRWALASSLALEQCSELQAEVLNQQSFEQKCESWMGFLQSMEDNLAVDIAGSYPGLREQLRIHQRFQVEVSIGHQILHSVINEALKLLERGEVEDRSDFILKLSQLKEQWQGVMRRAQQRRSLVEGLVKHWQLYTRSLKKLRKLLSDAHALLPPSGPVHCSLGQLHTSLEDLKHMDLLFQRHQSCYIQTLEVGRQLFSMGDAQTQAQLQTELGALQEDWEHSHSLLGKRRTLTGSIIQTWERCEAKLADRRCKLEDMKARLKQLLPEHPAELQTAEQVTKEAEDSLEDWAQSLTELATMKTDLSQYIIADDVVLLQEQVEHLRCQWEELCLKVSLRKQEIADRLNAWIIFNEKNKELCEWLTQMENKVAHNTDLSIEEMVEKLKKDCMEEINLFSENKTHLKQLGEQLITASNKTKETEINDKLKDINDRWQHLFDHIEARVRKLKETLVTVQQLDKNMSNLRTWLSRIEAELAKPVVYSVCHNDEIQRKLAEQQDLQRDIEQHTEGVASVLTLCDVLLHDADACGSDMENDSIQQTTRSLDRRWRNICAMSMERRMRIEETWRLWCKFLDDYSRFEDWLKTAERTAANPNSADVLYTSAKEELKKFEAFQRQVHERLTQLELVNKQYRRLARENRTDAASKLKVMVHEGNQRWDNLQRRVAAILRRLKHFTSQREEFEGTREGILVWLTEMDLQLTNVEHFSESDIDDKMRQLNGFQQEITLNTNKIDQLIVFGENLIQKCAPLDAVLIEDELEELHSYCQEVFGRVARFHHRLTSRRPMLDEDRDLSDRDTDLEDSGELVGGSWQEEKEGSSGDSPSRRAVCHLLAPPLERSGRETPVSVDSIPLEWDHTVDVGGSSSHEDDEEATFYSALSDVEITESPESFVKATTKALRAASGKSAAEPPTWHSPDSQDRKRLHRDLICGLGSSPTHTSTPYQQGYAKLMNECSDRIDNVKRVKLILNDDELPEEHGLTSLTTADKQSGVIGRWELLQAQARSEEMRVRHNLQQWQQLNSDLSDITAWLGRVLPELDRLRKREPPSTVRDMEGNIKELKDMQKTFEKYKAVMISVNLSGRDFQQGDSAEAGELQAGLCSMNQSWVKACTALDSWESQLQSTLMKCQEFHETLHSLLLWLAHTESRRFEVNIHDPSVELSVLREHSATLRGVEEELLERQREVSSLQAISSQLLLEAQGEDSTEAKEKVHVIGNKLRLLLRQVGQDLQALHGRLDSSSLTGPKDAVDCSGLGASGTQQSVSKEVTGERTPGVKPPGGRRDEKRDSSPPRSFFYRVLRAAVPLHLLLLLLLVLACLVPLSEEDYSCTLSNNFARSFYPMLHYTNGPPPT